MALITDVYKDTLGLRHWEPPGPCRVYLAGVLINIITDEKQLNYQGGFYYDTEYGQQNRTKSARGGRNSHRGKALHKIIITT